MTKERRLGRGLEALLGQLPVRNDSAQPAQQHGRRHHRRRPTATHRRATPPCGAFGGVAVSARRSARGDGPVLCPAAPFAGQVSAGTAVPMANPGITATAAVSAAFDSLEGGRREAREPCKIRAGRRPADRQQSGPAASGVRPERNAVAGREHLGPRAVAAGGGSARP